jgi:hypothetical protein
MMIDGDDDGDDDYGDDDEVRCDNCKVCSDGDDNADCK